MQGNNYHIMDYFQSKVRIFRGLTLLFGEVQNHLIRCIDVLDLAMFMLSGIHCNKNELLYDLLE